MDSMLVSFNILIFPRPASNGSWSVGSKYGQSDLYTCDQLLKDLLKGYDYLALFKSDKKFWK